MGSPDPSVLASKTRDFMWQWDPYGVAGDRNDTPDEYEDWVDELMRLIRSDADLEAIRNVVTAGTASEGLRVAPGLDEKLRDLLDSGEVGAGLESLLGGTCAVNDLPLGFARSRGVSDCPMRTVHTPRAA